MVQAFNPRNVSVSLVANPELVRRVLGGEVIFFTKKEIVAMMGAGAGELNAFPEDTILFRLLVIDNEVQCATFKMYRDDEGDRSVKLFDASDPCRPIDPTRVKGFKYVQYHASNDGYQLISVEIETGKAKGSETGYIAVPLALNAVYLKELRERNENPESIRKGAGLIERSLVRYRPRPVVNPRDFEIRTVVRIHREVGVSPETDRKRYECALISGGVEAGERFEMNANYSLEKILNQVALPCDVLVAGKKESKTYKGEIVVKFALADVANASVPARA